MATVYFMRNFDYHPAPRVLKAYKAGWEGTVKRECAEQAIAAGAAISRDTPPRKPRKTKRDAR